MNWDYTHLSIQQFLELADQKRKKQMGSERSESTKNPFCDENHRQGSLLYSNNRFSQTF